MRGTAEIVGGGIGGLFAGYLLARAGWKVRVNERSPQIREIGAGIFLKNNSITLLEHLGLADAILKDAIWLRRAEIRGRDDELLQRRELVERARVFNLPRTNLVLRLADAARSAGAEICVGATVAAVDPQGSIQLETGEIRKADLVLGADGFRSRIRVQLGLETASRELATGATRFLVPRTEFERDDMTREWWSGRRRIGIAPASKDLTYTYMSSPQSDVAGVALPVDIASWKQSFPTIAPFFDKLVGAPGGTRFPYAYVHSHRWSKGNVALIGDAAHSMPPTLGQGAGLTLMNSYVLVDELTQADDVSSALTRWEQRIRYVADETQKWALRYDALMANWPLWLSGLRRNVIWSVGRIGWLNAKMRIADRIDVTSGKAA